MLTRTLLGAAALFACLTLSATASAQATESCPQPPCMVLVPQPAPTTGTATAQIYVQPAPAPGPIAVAPPPEPVVRYRMRVGMVVAGAVMLGAGWLVNVLVGSVVGLIGSASGSETLVDYFGWSLIPIIGPWAQLGYFNLDTDTGLLAYHVVLGVVQTLGFVLALVGTIDQEEIVEASYVDLGSGMQLSVLPYASQGGGGLGATLTF